MMQIINVIGLLSRLRLLKENIFMMFVLREKL